MSNTMWVGKRWSKGKWYLVSGSGEWNVICHLFHSTHCQNMANIVTVNKTYESERDSDHGQHHNCLWKHSFSPNNLRRTQLITNGSPLVTHVSKRECSMAKCKYCKYSLDPMNARWALVPRSDSTAIVENRPYRQRVTTKGGRRDIWVQSPKRLTWMWRWIVPWGSTLPYIGRIDELHTNIFARCLSRCLSLQLFIFLLPERWIPGPHNPWKRGCAAQLIGNHPDPFVWVCLQSLFWFSSHSTGCLGGRKERKKEKKGERERLWEIKDIFFTLLHKSTIYYCTQGGSIRKNLHQGLSE